MFTRLKSVITLRRNTFKCITMKEYSQKVNFNYVKNCATHTHTNIIYIYKFHIYHKINYRFPKVTIQREYFREFNQLETCIWGIILELYKNGYSYKRAEKMLFGAL